jgi:hypothetical protein
LALVSFASADVRFFFTSSADPAGLNDTSLAFEDTAGNGTDFTDYALNGNKPSVGVPTINPTLGQFLYLWVKFEGEANNVKIQGINLSVDQDANELDRGIYIGNDENDSGEFRWEPSSQTTDPMVLVAVTKNGVKNSNSNLWLYYGGADRVALLGALQFAEGKYEVRIGLERQGVSYSGKPSPKVKLGAGDEQFDGSVQPPGTETRYAKEPSAVVVPEPAGLLLLALAGLALRRR